MQTKTSSGFGIEVTTISGLSTITGRTATASAADHANWCRAVMTNKYSDFDLTFEYRIKCIKYNQDRIIRFDGIFYVYANDDLIKTKLQFGFGKVKSVVSKEPQVLNNFFIDFHLSSPAFTIAVYHRNRRNIRCPQNPYPDCPIR